MLFFFPFLFFVLQFDLRFYESNMRTDKMILHSNKITHVRQPVPNSFARPSIRPSVRHWHKNTDSHLYTQYTYSILHMSSLACPLQEKNGSISQHTHISLFHLFAVFFFLRLFLSSVQFCVVVFAARAVFFFIWEFCSRLPYPSLSPFLFLVAVQVCGCLFFYYEKKNHLELSVTYF